MNVSSLSSQHFIYNVHIQYILTVYSQGDVPFNGSNSSIIQRAGKDAVAVSLGCESKAAHMCIVAMKILYSCTSC